MRARYLPWLFVLLGCEDATEPVLPPQGHYTLTAVAEFALPGSATDPGWKAIPFVYDVSGDRTCEFEVTAGSLQVVGRTYSVTFQQRVVSCAYAWEPLSSESGQVSKIWDATAGRFAPDFAFRPQSDSLGWMISGQVSGSTIIASMSNPQTRSRPIHYLLFEKQ